MSVFSHMLRRPTFTFVFYRERVAALEQADDAAYERAVSRHKVAQARIDLANRDLESAVESGAWKLGGQ